MPETVVEARRFGSIQLVTGFLGNLPQEDVARVQRIMEPVRQH
jgi:hypothetical protein